MESQKIKNIALQMQTKLDLLNLINTIKKDELKDQYHPYTMKQLGYFCNPNHVFHRYRNFEIPKKSGGTRQISAPYSHSYMHLLRYVGIILQSIYEPSTHAMGFIPNRSIVDNASAHKGMNYVFNIDLKDFFPTIERARIVARLQVRPFCFIQEIALTIAGLCTMRISNGEEVDKKYKYVLPQGSPASPVMTNLMCDKLDYCLSGLAKRFGLNYTRYADDITFSSMHNVYQDGSDFRQELERIISTQGYTINPKKTRLNKVGARQEVTGLTVSQDKVNVARKYVRDLRGLLYIWEEYGYAQAEARMHTHQADKRSYKKGTSLGCVVIGKLMFLSMVKGKEDSTYQKLQHRYDVLINKQQKYQPQHTNLIYRETYNVLDFEKKNNTIITLEQKENSKNGTCTINEETISILIYHDIDVNTPKNQLDISLCEPKDGATSFWLIHKPYKSHLYNDIVDLDKLNEDLDEILNSQNGCT